MDFLFNNFDYIDSAPVREKILLRAFKEGKTKFLSKYFDELPKNIQMEAVIKYNDLDIPEEKIQGLLKK